MPDNHPRPGPTARSRGWLPWLLTIALCLLHGYGLWLGLGGFMGLTSPWPLAKDDHPMHFHDAVVLRPFLRSGRLPAAYDPSFMAGYPLSVVSDQSGTLPQLAVALGPADRPAMSYKLFLLLSCAAGPWLLAWSVRALGGRAEAALVAVLLFDVYLWTDFPINYAAFGMMTYLLAIPLALVTTIVATRFLDRGGWWCWLQAVGLITLTLLTHALTLMILVPAFVSAYLGAVIWGWRGGPGIPWSRHLGIWFWPIVALGLNAWWLLPWYWLASTGDTPLVAFYHPEPLSQRLAKIVLTEAPVEVLLWAGALFGMAVLARVSRLQALAVGGFLVAGVVWGYLAGAIRSLDVIQPGRHTYAFYTGAALCTGLGWTAVRDRLRDDPLRLDRFLFIALILIGLRMFGVPLQRSLKYRLGGEETFLSSRPTATQLWLIDKIRLHLRPGTRLLYEEGGNALPDLPDPFQGHRFGGLLPFHTGVEVIGGPFLHVMMQTNFTQFGEGKLIGRDQWGRQDFLALAPIYRPEAIVCWSPRARAFCRENPDLVEVLEDDGFQILGRVRGFEGAAIEGKATVRAQPGRLIVEDAQAGVDGRVVLRYHYVPHLRSDPPIFLEPVSQGSDPVPFIGFRPGPTRLSLVLDLTP